MIRPAIPLSQKQIVVDVDTQKHFFINNSPICVRDHLSVLSNIRRVMAWVRMRHIHMVSTVQMFPGNAICHNFNTIGGLSLKKINCTLHNNHINFDATDYTDLSGRILRQYDQIILYKRYFDPFEEPRADRQKLDRADAVVLGGLAEAGGGLAEIGPCVLVDHGAWGLFNQFLVPPLHRAVAFEQVNAIAVAVTDDLDLDVSSALQELLDVD